MTLLAALTPMPLRAVEPPRPHERQHSSISGQTVLGKHTVAQWRELVDATWGPGLTASEQVEIFDAAWTTSTAMMSPRDATPWSRLPSAGSKAAGRGAQRRADGPEVRVLPSPGALRSAHRRPRHHRLVPGGRCLPLPPPGVPGTARKGPAERPEVTADAGKRPHHPGTQGACPIRPGSEAIVGQPSRLPFR
jgi:hypothetical protein